MNSKQPLEPLPADRIMLDNNVFQGYGYVYRKNRSELMVCQVTFGACKKLPLEPFKYNKPITNPEDMFAYPQELIMDSEPRKDYYPIAIVSQALRTPNHMYEDDEGLFTAVKTEEGWQTRYFPRHSLDTAVWEDSIQKLQTSKK